MIDKIGSSANSLSPQSIGDHVSKAEQSFADVMRNSMAEANKAQLQGDSAIQELQSGNAEHLHEVMLSVEKADISLRMLVQMRNKAMSAYEEIMRMQL